MKKKFLAGGALLAALALVATGCAGSSDDGADAGGDGPITVGFAQTGLGVRLAQRRTPSR